MSLHRARLAHPRLAVLGRGGVVLLAAVVAFHTTVTDTAREILEGNPLVYLVLVPFWALIIAIGTRQRRSQELPIHDRQLDWIVAVLLYVFAVLLDELLLPRIGTAESLFRVDILGMTLFVISTAVLLFGTRASGRYWVAWIFVGCCWPLPYQLAGAFLGGTPKAFAEINVLLATIALALGPGSRRHRLIAALVTLVFGAIGTKVFHGFSPITAEIAPAVVATGAGMLLNLRPAGRPEHGGSRASGNAVARPLPAFGVVVILSIAFASTLGFAAEPQLLLSSANVRAAWISSPVSLDGYSASAVGSYPWASAYFGPTSSWSRYRFIEGTKAPAHLSSVLDTGVYYVDALTTPTRGALSVYTSSACYRLDEPYSTDASTIRLSGGVAATLYYADSADAESPTDAGWLMLAWQWRIPKSPAGQYQRVDVLAVDSMDWQQAFPTPAPPGTNNSVRGTLSDILRGAESPAGSKPDPATLLRLKRFANALIAAQGRSNTATVAEQ